MNSENEELKSLYMKVDDETKNIDVVVKAKLLQEIEEANCIYNNFILIGEAYNTKLIRINKLVARYSNKRG